MQIAVNQEDKTLNILATFTCVRSHSSFFCEADPGIKTSQKQNCSWYLSDCLCSEMLSNPYVLLP